MPIFTILIRRLLVAIPTLLIVSFISFTIMRYDFTLGPIQFGQGPKALVVMPKVVIKNPIDPLAELRLNPQISKAALEHEQQRLGLDKPFLVQYVIWLQHVLRVDWSELAHGRFWNFFQPDFGKSFTGQDVTRMLAERIPNTLLLNLVALIINWIVAIPLGVYAALNWRSKVDTLSTLLSSIGMAAPSFVVATMAGVFAVKTGWLPYGGIMSDNVASMPLPFQVWDVMLHLALPVFVMSFLGIAGLQRQMRGNLLDVLEAEYVRVARAKGLPENVVIYKHAVRTAINPLVTMLGFELAAMLSGSAIVEMVLRFPGIGLLTYQAVVQTDTNLVMTTLLMGSALLIAGNLMSDILLSVVDPRIELR